MDRLSKKDETFLLSILRLGEEAYGVAIRRKIEETTGKRVGYGTLYSALDQLVRKRFIIKITGEPTPKKGGRRKYYYRLTGPGADALKEARKQSAALWRDITDGTLDTIK